MGNELKTTFIFDTAQGEAKADALRKNLFALNKDLNSFNPTFGKNLNSQFEVANKSVNQFGGNLKTLKQKVEDFKPTTDFSKLTASIDKLDKQLLSSQKSALTLANNFNKLGQTSLQKDALNILNRLREIDTQLTKKPNGTFLQKLELESKSLGRELTGLQKKLIDVRETEAIFQGIKKEINNSLTASPTRPRPNSPNAQSTRLSPFQLQNLSYQVNDVLTGIASGQPLSQIAAQQSGQIAQIFNVAQISAFIAKYGTLVSVIGAGTVALTATYSITNQIRTLAEQRLKNEDLIQGAINKQVLGLQSARAEYEKFKQSVLDSKFLGENIQSAINRSDTGAIKTIQNKADAENKAQITEINRLQAKIRDDERELEFAKNRKTNSGLTSDLGFTNRFTEADKNRNIRAVERRIEERQKQIQEAENRLNQGKQTFQQTVSALDSIAINQDKLFFARSDAYVQSQNQIFEARKQAEEKAAQEFAKSVELGKKKVEEFGKVWTDTFNNLSLKINQNNPFVQVFSEAERNLNSLKESLKGLPKDLQQSAFAIQNRINSNALFSTRLDNAISVLKLTEDVEKIRNPFKDDLYKFNKNPVKSFEEFIDFYINQLKDATTDKLQKFANDSTFGGTVRIENRPFAGYAKESTFGGFTQYDLRNELLYSYDRLGNGSTIRRQRSFQDLSESDKLRYLQDINQVDKSALNTQQRLDKQFAVVNSLSANATPEQLEIANRKILSLADGVDPRQLREDQRQQLALAKEKEAVRLVNEEKEAKKWRENMYKLLEKIEEYEKALYKKNQKEGVEGIIRIVDDTNGRVNVRLGKTPTEADTKRLFEQ